MSQTRKARVFKNGANRAIRIPREFDFVGDEVLIYKEADRLVIEPVKNQGLCALLASWTPLDASFPDVDEDLPPLDPVSL